ncbi:hypothetical protein LINPERHAP2_LOCUS26001 [Linum perenne]
MSKRGPNWSVEEDEALCRVWCKISCDGDIGNEQKGLTFWGRTEAAFKAIMLGSTRTKQSMESRFKLIGMTCSKMEEGFEEGRCPTFKWSNRERCGKYSSQYLFSSLELLYKINSINIMFVEYDGEVDLQVKYE